MGENKVIYKHIFHEGHNILQVKMFTIKSSLNWYEKINIRVNFLFKIWIFFSARISHPGFLFV